MFPVLPSFPHFLSFISSGGPCQFIPISHPSITLQLMAIVPGFRHCLLFRHCVLLGLLLLSKRNTLPEHVFLIPLFLPACFESSLRYAGRIPSSHAHSISIKKKSHKKSTSFQFNGNILEGISLTKHFYKQRY